MSERNKPFAWLYDQDVLEHARNAYAMRWWNITDNYEEGVERFNTMLAQQRAEAKAEALREAAGAIEQNNIVFDGDHYQPCNSCRSIHMNWLDYRADQLEADDD